MDNTPSATENFFMRRATAVAIGAVTMLMLAAALLFWRQGEASLTAKGWVEHTFEVRGHIRRLINRVETAELNRRSYMLYGTDEYLSSYQENIKDATGPHAEDPSSEQQRSARQELAILRRMTVDNPTQQANLDEMADSLKDLAEYQATSIKMHRENPEGSKSQISNPQEITLMGRIENMARLIEAEETHLLKLRTELDDSTTRQNTMLTLMLSALFYVAMTVSIWIYQRSRARSTAQMLLYTQELERSEEELKMQQEELKASNEEIEASNEELEEKTRALEEQNAQIQQQAGELEESQRLIEEKARDVERASRYKSEFLANMSHELRTPLNSLLILAKLLASNEEGNLTEEQIEEAQVIHNGGMELLGLINDILDLSKVEAGKLTVMPEHTALANIVDRMRQQFTPVANDKDVAFPITVADDLPDMLHTDTQRVEQILKNLLSNAFKFTEQGSVTLEVRRPEQSETQRSSLDHARAVAFSVTDTGVGIESSKFRDIFEAFQQEDGSIDRHYGGTGLGLTIARKFAHMLGGEIHIASKKGEGSRFTLVLPLRMAGGEIEEMHAPTAPTESPYIELKAIPKTFVTEFIPDDRQNICDKDRVLLIIEDDPVFAAMLIKIAHKRGCKCIAAGDGKSGLVLAHEQPVDAIILDLKLPDIDGLNVLDQLKHDLRTRHIPVHIISGREDGNVIPLRKGAIGYLVKPAPIEAIEGAFVRIEHLLQSDVKQVLVVEDDKKTQIAIQVLLKKKEIQLTLADMGADGLRHIENTKFDCVILDLQLPDMTGFEWLENIEVSLGEAAPPVIIYTARELSEEENRRLSRYTGAIIIKGAKSPERLLDEVTLFLHSVESTLTPDQQEIIRMQHNPDKVLQGRTLLLVDDDLRNTFALSKLLRKHGMNVIIADNGQMALDKLEQDRSIELVIMDIMMPVMDGYQAMCEIRARLSLAGLPIIALTARAMPEEQEKCIMAGANDYLTKPVDIERLLTLLRVWLFRQEMAA
ncbi:MAG: response regulator [Sphingobium sp.]